MVLKFCKLGRSVALSCWCVCMRGLSASKILHFHLFFSSIHQFFVWCRNNYDKTETPKNKHWTFKITKVRTEGNSFFFNITHSRKPLDQIYTTSLLDFFTLHCLFLSSSGTTAPCTPSVFARLLVLVFHLKPLLIKQCLFDINRLGVKGKLHNSKICEFEIAFLSFLLLFHRRLWGLMCSISSLLDRSWFTSVGAKVKLLRGSLLL